MLPVKNSKFIPIDLSSALVLEISPVYTITIKYTAAVKESRKMTPTKDFNTISQRIFEKAVHFLKEKKKV